ncbi:MAG: response regulator [Roseburia sp.]|nr:response regulator [Roseburia sp.]
METEHMKNKQTPVILIVDDISINVEILEHIITHAGYETMCALSVPEAISLIKTTKPSLILSDLSMPEVDGLEFCRMLKSDPGTRDIPFIVISVLDTSEEKEQAFLAGAVDFIPKPFEAVEVIMRVNNQLNSYRMKQEMADYNRRMHKLVENQKKQLEQVQKNILLALANIMARRDEGMERHLENVGYNCRLLAQGLQFIPKYESEITDEFVETIETAAKLHAAGSLVLTGEDWFRGGRRDGPDKESIRKYTEEGVEILREICTGLNESRFLSMALRIAECQYANWDGTGYPALKGKEIPLEARIAALVNDFDGFVSGGQGKDESPPQEGFQRISEGSGIFYEPDLVDVFNKIKRRIRS